MNWKKTFYFQEKHLYYNRINFNNLGERTVEIPIAFNFLANLGKKDKILEVGNVLSYYENSLSEYMGLRARRIIDKFEVESGVDNIDLMEIPSDEKYDAIVSISTVEHVGQGVEPSGAYGEEVAVRELEAPLKAIVKIYDLLAIKGKALITVPFGKLMDGGWFIQFDWEYLELLVSKYNIPKQAISTVLLKRFDMELTNTNPRQVWGVVEDTKLIDKVEYFWPWPCANAIAVIELTKVRETFYLNLDVPTTPLVYSYPTSDPRIIYSDLIESKFFLLLKEQLRDINLIFFPNWSQPEEDVRSDIERVIRSVLTHPDKPCMTLLIDSSNISDEDANLILTGVTMNLLLTENLEVTDEPEISILGNLSEIQWAAILPRIHCRIVLENSDEPESGRAIADKIPPGELDSLSDRRAIQLETGFWDLR